LEKWSIFNSVKRRATLVLGPRLTFDHLRGGPSEAHNGSVHCESCHLLGKDHLLAFDQYKVAILELSLAGGYLSDDVSYGAAAERIEVARDSCDVAMSAMLEHIRLHSGYYGDNGDAHPNGKLIVMPQK
jgi:hypothetical protein